MFSLFQSSSSARCVHFKGKHVLVTGASSGIGRAIALELAACGATLSLVARGQQRLDDAAADVRASMTESSAGRVLAMPFDCSDHAQVVSSIRVIEQDLGPIDVLINCAGGAQGTYFEALTPELAESQMRGNYFSQLYPTQAVFSRMRERGSPGHVVLVSSMAGLVGVFGCSPYCPAKYALRGLAETIYYDMKEHNVDVTIAYPPDTDTPGHRQETATLPPETIEINASAGLFTAEHVAEAILNGVVRRQFRVTVGLDGKMLGILTTGMSPGPSLVECLLLPIMRGITSFYTRGFLRIIARHLADRVRGKCEAPPPPTNSPLT
jgi:3-dehydrosphinganine reductase